MPGPRPRRPTAIRRRPRAARRAGRTRHLRQHRELLRIGVLRLVEDDAPALLADAVKHRRVAEHRHRRVDLVAVSLHPALETPRAVAPGQLGRERRRRRRQPPLQGRHPLVSQARDILGRARRLVERQETRPVRPRRVPLARAALAQLDVRRAPALERQREQLVAQRRRGRRRRPRRTPPVERLRRRGVELLRQRKHLLQRHVPQKGPQLRRAEHGEGHSILLQKLLPQRLVVLRHHRRIQVDAEGLAVGLRELETEAVNGAEKRPLQLVQRREVAPARRQHFFEQHRPRAPPDLTRRLFGEGHHRGARQQLRPAGRERHRGQPLRDRGGLARAGVGADREVAPPLVAEPVARRLIGQGCRRGRVTHRPRPPPTPSPRRRPRPRRRSPRISPAGPPPTPARRPAATRIRRANTPSGRG